MVDHPPFVFHPSVVSAIRFKAYQLVRGRSDHTWDDIPDLEQSMFMHLWLKGDQFDPVLSSEGAFASTVIDRWIAQYLRDRGRIKRGGMHRTTPFSQLGVNTPARGVSFDDLLSARDGDRRRWQHTENLTERFDRLEALGVALGLLTTFQISLLEDVSNRSVSYAARSRGITRRVVDREMTVIRKIFTKCGLSLQTVCSR